MNIVHIDNGYFSRQADPSAASDKAFYQLALANGLSVVSEELDASSKAIMNRYIREMQLGSFICSRPKAYERDSFMDYLNLHSTLFVLNQWGLVVPKRILPQDMWGMVDALEQKRNALTRITDPDEGLWYIWGKDMPNCSIAETADWRYCYDTPDYKPFLIPYMLEDQSMVKGNIIIVSGGGYEWRSNRWEGYEAVDRFNALGYNAFLLQRRVAPYTKLDGAMDLQRAIRYLKANAERYGIQAIEHLAVNGYSGGGMCIIDMLSGCYSSASPADYYPDYHEDEIDSFSSKVSAALIIYGANPARLTEPEGLIHNPDLPGMFIVSGQEDFVSMDTGSTKLYDLVRSIVPTELHIYASVPHGFGVGNCEDVSDPSFPKNISILTASGWPEMADLFLMTQWEIITNKQPR